MPGFPLSEEDAERLAWLWADLEACVCQMWARPKCDWCRAHERELQLRGWDRLDVE